MIPMSDQQEMLRFELKPTVEFFFFFFNHKISTQKYFCFETNTKKINKVSVCAKNCKVSVLLCIFSGDT